MSVDQRCLFIKVSMTTAVNHLGEMEIVQVIDNRLHSAEIRISNQVTNRSAFREAQSHETGHTFGLDDCSACQPNTSAMTLHDNPDFNTYDNGSEFPTNCDEVGAHNAGAYPDWPYARKVR
jgi:hypothetical protein